MGLVPVPLGLTTHWVLGQFAKTKPVAHTRYAEFVHAGIGKISPWKERKGHVILRGESFVQQIATQLNNSNGMTEIPKHQRQLHTPALKTLMLGAAESKAAQNDAIAQAHLTYGDTLAEISKEMCLHYASISCLIKALAQMPQYKM